ncbi:MAG TPA: hypothetical protein PLW14_09140 [Chlorobiota bacterium]|nr:hypothetical protein [Chlorobiota bacterium]
MGKTLEISKDGSLGVVGTSDNITTEQQARLRDANMKMNKAKVAQRQFAQQEAVLEQQLLEESATYRKLIKLRKKRQMMKALEKEQDVILSALAQELFAASPASRGKSLAEFLDESIELPADKRRLPRRRT